MAEETPLVHNKDGSTRFFECDPDEGGCGKFTLTAHVKDTRVHIYCNICGYDSWENAPVPLTNPSGSASYIGAIPGGRGL
jgi:hypothetical protein